MATKKKTNTTQTIYRVACRHKPYAQLGNAMIRDNRLSFEARGVLAYILSYPPNWRFSQEWLCEKAKLGKHRSYRIINELRAFGYCQRAQQRRSDGTLGPYEYVFTDEPEALEPVDNWPDGTLADGSEEEPQDIGGVDNVGPAEAHGAAPPLPENREAVPPLPGKPEAADPEAANREAAYKDLNTISPKDTDLPKRDPAPAASPLRNGSASGGEISGRICEGRTDRSFVDAVAAIRRAAALAAAEAGSAGVASGERLPFTPATLREVAALGLDVTELIDLYRTKTARRKLSNPIKDPNAYLLRMAREEAGKRQGIPADALAVIAAGNEHQRGAVFARVLGADAEPSDKAIRGFMRSVRLRGGDPEAAMRSWRASVAAWPVRTTQAADANLMGFLSQLWFADQIAAIRRPVPPAAAMGAQP